jgi:DNA-binding FadR family transcriptional regulator
MSGGLHARVLNDLGLDIVSGQISPESTVFAEKLEERYGVSRSVMREAVRVLQSLGMVASVKRVGMRVLPMSQWSLYDPLVIRWRLEQAENGQQLRSLTELRNAIEPQAARLAAIHASDDAASELLALAARMRSVGRSGDLELFLELDIRFHSLVLAASGNEMFARLDRVVAEVLTGRTHRGLMPSTPHEEALQLHVDVADAIQGKRPDDAYASMERVMSRTIEEVEPTWAGEPRIFLE